MTPAAADTRFRVVCLAGDGIGPEVMREAIRALQALPLRIEIDERPFGGPGIRASGDPLPAATLAACREADAVLLAAVGSPEYERADIRPEQGLLRIRSGLGVFANLRPVRADSVDVMIVRELSGGLYSAAPASAATAASSPPARAPSRRRTGTSKAGWARASRSCTSPMPGSPPPLPWPARSCILPTSWEELPHEARGPGLRSSARRPSPRPGRALGSRSRSKRVPSTWTGGRSARRHCHRSWSSC